MKIGCVVLAAGRSRRFGDNKLLQPLGDRTVLAHVLSALPRERLERIAVVASSPEVEGMCVKEKIPCLRYPGGAQSESIRLGIGLMDGLDGCLFVMGDQPLCTRKSMERMIDAFWRCPEAVIRLAWGSTLCSPVLFPQECFSALKGLTGERGGMSALKGRAARVLPVQAEDEAELWDVDTREDLEKIEQRLKDKCRLKP